MCVNYAENTKGVGNEYLLYRTLKKFNDDFTVNLTLHAPLAKFPSSGLFIKWPLTSVADPD